MKTKNHIIKSFFALFSFLSFLTANAQAPQKMSYQAVIRNASNTLVTNSGIGMKISILQGSASGAEVYKELFNPNPVTNSNGLVSLEIGTGLPINGVFSAIDWSVGPYFIKTETDPAGGTNYTIVATSQLLSVPFALHANYAETVRAVPVKYYILSCGVFPNSRYMGADTIGTIISRIANKNATVDDGCYLPCDGRLLEIRFNEAFYQLIGTTYGGDGVTTFAIPNLNNGSLTKGY